ncbi:GNAT family N-acetyltransferase [Phytoactinopolyspora limicola]|uniref:GNAT family N-acetyltransferase n=1 Tax=Phytoactinopolyspora limicola TaxID=2715536 RepID=UPI00140DE944
MLADDELGAQREAPDRPEPYLRAFEAIEADPHQLLVVAERAGVIVGTLQLTLIPGLSHQGGWRAQVEGVRVHATERGTGLGRLMIDWAVQEARGHGARMIQLTTDASRTRAHRFYEQLGFRPTHVGFKLPLVGSDGEEGFSR